MFKYLIYKFGEFWVNRIPLKTAYRIGIFLSDMQFFFSFRDRRAVRNNLKNILGPEENLTYLTREVFRNFGRYLVEFFRMARDLNEDYIRENVTIENIDVVKKALQLKKGVVMVTGHLGNWELGGVVMAKLGYPPVAIALPHKERPVNDLFNMQREHHGITVIPTNHAIRRCLEALKENRIVALLADRDFTLNGEKLPWLNKQAMIPKGAAIFSEKTGAPIVPIFFIWQGEGKFKLTFESAIFPSQERSENVPEEKLINLMKQYASVIEEKIRQYPAQWLMYREFWVN